LLHAWHQVKDLRIATRSFQPGFGDAKEPIPPGNKKTYQKKWMLPTVLHDFL
jgi:hypothetical protein